MSANDEKKSYEDALNEFRERRNAKIACLKKVHFSPVFLGNVNFPAEINMEFKGRKLFPRDLWISLASRVALC